jgi:hypothetical protein
VHQAINAQTHSVRTTAIASQSLELKLGLRALKEISAPLGSAPTQVFLRHFDFAQA